MHTGAESTERLNLQRKRVQQPVEEEGVRSAVPSQPLLPAPDTYRSQIRWRIAAALQNNAEERHIRRTQIPDTVTSDEVPQLSTCDDAAQMEQSRCGAREVGELVSMIL